MPAEITFARPVVWVVGASRGIGREIAREFAAAGCEVCLSSRNSGELLAASREIARLGGRASSFPCDLLKIPSVRRAAAAIVRKFDHVDVLVNNGGITVFKSFAGTSMRELDAIVHTNLIGPAACIKAVLPHMMRRRSGCIINVLSTAAVKIFTGSSAYTASKAGLYGLSNVLREELRPRNIRVLNVLPGATATDMWGSASRRRHGSRMMRPRSVAEAVVAAYELPPDVVAEEILMRPIGGDIG